LKARLSITTIDWWLSWEEATLYELQGKLTHRQPQTEAMLRGIAFHEALAHLSSLCEGADYTTTDSIDSRGFTFDFNGVEIQIESVSPYQTELKIERRIDSSLLDTEIGSEITLVGKVDRIDGSTVEDHKTTSHFDAERLLASWQWRFYLWLTGADVFRWHVYEMKPMETPRKAFAAWLKRFDDWRDNPPAEELAAALRRYKVTNYHQLEAARYPNLEAECLGAMDQFLRAVNLLCDAGNLDPGRVGIPAGWTPSGVEVLA